MIPNLKMGYYHQREYLERPYNIQMGEKLPKKPMKVSMEGFEYSSFLTSRTYSILSYLVGGFVGSKSQKNNDKHNLSYDLSAAIFNLLNPCKNEREKCYKRNNDNFYCTTSKINAEDYNKYIVRSSQREKMIDLGLEWFENCVLDIQECYNYSQNRKDSYICDEEKLSNDSQINIEISKLEDCSNNSINMTDRVSVCGIETSEKNEFDFSIGCLRTERLRQHSECSVESSDSENFIVFDNPNEDDEKKSENSWKLEDFDFDSEDESNDDDIDDDGDDGHDDVIYSIDKSLAEANDKWKRNYENMEMEDHGGQRKVRFSEDVKVNKIVAWDFAYRAARLGPWEQMARDRVRFRERILRLSPTISDILRKEHRDKMYKKLYS